MKKKFIECGKIVTTHGINGEVKLHPWSDEVDFLADFKYVYTDNGETKLHLTSCRANKTTAILKFNGINLIEEAAPIINKIIYISREDLKLDDGDYLIQDLIGLTVKDVDTDRIYGVITDVHVTGANDVYSITDTDGTERLIPAIKQVVISTDIDNDIMLIRPLKGLFEDMEEIKD